MDELKTAVEELHKGGDVTLAAYKTIKFAIEELEQRSEAGQVDAIVINRLKAKAENAYISYIDAHRKDECLGWEAKVLHGNFGSKELEAHKKAQEWFGKHCAYHEAIRVIEEEGL